MNNEECYKKAEGIAELWQELENLKCSKESLESMNNINHSLNISCDFSDTFGYSTKFLSKHKNNILNAMILETDHMIDTVEVQLKNLLSREE